MRFETFQKGNRFFNHVVRRGTDHAYTFSTSPEKFMSSSHIDAESFHLLLHNKYNSDVDSFELPPIKIPASITDVEVSETLVELHNDVISSPNYFLTTSICLRYILLFGMHLVESGYLDSPNPNYAEFMVNVFNSNPNMQFIREHYSLVPHLEDTIIDISKNLIKILDDLSNKEERYAFLYDVLSDIDIKVLKQAQTLESIKVEKELFSLDSMYLYKGTNKLN